MTVSQADIVSDASVRVLPVRAVRDSSGKDCLRFWEGQSAPHVTLWTAPKVRPSHSNVLLRRLQRQQQQPDPTKDAAAVVHLTGLVGARVSRLKQEAMGSASSASLSTAHSNLSSSSVSRKVVGMCMDLFGAGVPNSKIRFKPNQLSPAARYAVHTWAEACGLQTHSDGQGKHRRLTISVPMAFGKAEKLRGSDEMVGMKTGQEVITARARLFELIGTPETDLPELKLESDANVHCKSISGNQKAIFDGSKSSIECVNGTAANTNVSPIRSLFIGPQNLISETSSCPFIATSLGDSASSPASTPTRVPVHLVVVMRGLPGAGKSSFVRMLRGRWEDACGAGVVVAGPFVVCSADHFFEEGAGTLSKRKQKGMGPLEIYRRCYSNDLLSNVRVIYSRT